MMQLVRRTIMAILDRVSAAFQFASFKWPKTSTKEGGEKGNEQKGNKNINLVFFR